jgi:predicted glycosyltransferase
MILSADWVVCRSGYSSVMDLVKLGQKAVLVPTPGQTEQEYLAHYLLEKGYFYSEQQDIFNLTQALEKAARFNGRIQQLDMDGYKRILGSLISSCAN